MIDTKQIKNFNLQISKLVKIVFIFLGFKFYYFEIISNFAISDFEFVVNLQPISQQE